MKDIIKIIITDDHAMFRQGIISLLKEFSGIHIVGEAGNGEELLRVLNTKSTDLILLDIQMPVMNGSQALEIIKIRFPDIKIILVSMDFNSFLLEQYIEKGIHGFIPKGCDVEILIKAIHMVYTNGNCHKLSRSILKPFANKFNLTEREISVLRLACQGKSNKEIGTILFITERTVEFHKTNIYSKSNFKNPADLISYGIKNGLDI